MIRLEKAGPAVGDRRREVQKFSIKKSMKEKIFKKVSKNGIFTFSRFSANISLTHTPPGGGTPLPSADTKQIGGEKCNRKNKVRGKCKLGPTVPTLVNFFEFCPIFRVVFARGSSGATLMAERLDGIRVRVVLSVDANYQLLDRHYM